jgi:hypothetical protein
MMQLSTQFLVGLAGLSMLASCNALPLPDRKEMIWQNYMTVVDAQAEVTYAFPEGSYSLSPEPRDQVQSVVGQRVTLGGYAYPSGAFDRILFSTMYRLEVDRFTRPLINTANDLEAAYRAAQQDREQQGRARGAVLSHEIGETWQVQLGGGTWVCGNFVSPINQSLAMKITCVTTLQSDSVLGITVTFARGSVIGTEGYRAGRQELMTITERVRIVQRRR